MAKQHLPPFPLLVIIFLHCTTTLAQSPAQPPSQSPPQAPPQPPPQTVAAPPTSSGPTNVTAILEKDGHYTTLIRLLKTTGVDAAVFKQINTTNQGATLFAPTDNAFGNLTTGTLNSLTDTQKAELIQFHVLKSYIPPSQFQTVTNPILTLAGPSARLPLNVTTSGTQVNITTGIVNATVGGTIYTDGLLAVYQLDQVLLPYDIYGPPAAAPTPALAPAPSKPEKKPPSLDAPPAADATKPVTTSAATTVQFHNVLNAMSFLVLAAATFGMS